MKTILIVEDELHIAEGLKFNLEAEGYSAEIVANGLDAVNLVLQNKKKFDAIVLDVMLPSLDGFEVAKQLRNENVFVPILMLTARGRPEDVLLGFEAGADDYLPKPFELSIFLARLNGLLRRKQWLQNEPEVRDETEAEIFEINGKKIDFGNLQLHSDSETIFITVMEAKLLRHLIEKKGQAVSRKEILEQVWGLNEETDTRAIDNFIVRLRRYLEDTPSKPKILETVRGIGYRFTGD